MESIKHEMRELENICAPVVAFLEKKHPHYSVTIDSESIKLNETVMGVPTAQISAHENNGASCR